jgi:apolipoprotein N-acyltransferase
MNIYSGWIIREVIRQLRRPERGAQRKFVFGFGLVLAAFLWWAFAFLMRQETEADLERAAIFVFAMMGALIAVALVLAFVVRRKTGARWTTEETSGRSVKEN